MAIGIRFKTVMLDHRAAGNRIKLETFQLTSKKITLRRPWLVPWAWQLSSYSGAGCQATDYWNRFLLFLESNTAAITAYMNQSWL